MAKAKKQYETNFRGAAWTETRITTIHDPETGQPKVISPALTGKIQVDGKDYTIRMWHVVSDNPKAPAYSIAISEPKS
jgi:hypothetical protein